LGITAIRSSPKWSPKAFWGPLHRVFPKRKLKFIEFIWLVAFAPSVDD